MKRDKDSQRLLENRRFELYTVDLELMILKSQLLFKTAWNKYPIPRLVEHHFVFIDEGLDVN